MKINISHLPGYIQYAMYTSNDTAAFTINTQNTLNR